MSGNLTNIMNAVETVRSMGLGVQDDLPLAFPYLLLRWSPSRLKSSNAHHSFVGCFMHFNCSLVGLSLG